jgi:single-stranded-DNA-specific exonuclease
LLVNAKLDNKPRLDAADLGFSLGPRLNAAGRLGQAQLGVELLVTENSDKASELAACIDNLNTTRRTIDRKIFLAANELVQKNYIPENEPALVLAAPDWHLGVIGIVAGRIAETYGRPTILISTDPLKTRPGVGSCRSSCGVNLYEALDNCKKHLIRFGGHRAAAGLTIEEDKIDEFREELCQQITNQVSVDELIPDLDIDAEALIGHLTMGMMKDLEKLEPFGQQNPRPVLCASGVQLAEPVRTMGSEGRHLSLRLKQHDSFIRAVAFGKGEWLADLKDENQLYDFAFQPMINDFRGRKSVEIKLIDFRPSESSVASA